MDDTRLLVVGHGEVATALEAIARALGWAVTVVDSLEETVDALEASDTVVVLSHHEGVDGPAIAAALDSSATYVGAMGSRTTQARRRAWMLANGVPESELARLRAPVGLDIGADSPGEIAVSVVAEVIAQRRGVSGGSISERTGPIHPGLAPGTAECPSG
jgi:xanthine dehydrogenase accessory factor